MCIPVHFIYLNVCYQVQPDSEGQELQKEQEHATSASGRGSGSWQGWLTGWYSWYGTDTTDGTPGVTKGNDTNQMFMGEPPTTKGKLKSQHTCNSLS